MQQSGIIFHIWWARKMGQPTREQNTDAVKVCVRTMESFIEM